MTTPTPPLLTPTVDYSSRDYASIRDDLLTNVAPVLMPEWTSRSASDFGVLLVELFSYVGDGLHYYADRIANEAFLETATQRSSVLRIARQLGYVPSGQIAATATLLITNSDVSNAVTVPAGTQVATVGSTATSTQVIFETNTAVTVAASSTNTVLATQGSTVTLEVLTAAADGSLNQTYQLFNSPVVEGPSPATQVSVYVNGVKWTYIPRMFDSGPTDQVFTLTIDENNNVSVVFGDGINGGIPSAGSPISATYRVGGGAAGNVAANLLTVWLSVFTGVGTVTVTNTAAASGGADVESTASIRLNAAKTIGTLQRAVSLKDFAALAVTYPGVKRANATATVPTSVSVYIASAGSGNDTGAGFTALLASAQAYLQTVAAATVSVTTIAPTYVPIDITAVLHLAPQFAQSSAVSNGINALTSLLGFDNVVFGDTISLTDVHSALLAIPGVVWADVTVLQRHGGSNVVGTGTPYVTLAANEIPTAVGNTAFTGTVSATGGLAA